MKRSDTNANEPQIVESLKFETSTLQVIQSSALNFSTTTMSVIEVLGYCPFSSFSKDFTMSNA
ncbi:MAG: hypothetical protein QF633_04535, partial [Candidatus Poseidoniaceae archaeon]|nr:hypothetical protein [Candidatus Poseidoniaceae archaeon]